MLTAVVITAALIWLAGTAICKLNVAMANDYRDGSPSAFAWCVAATVFIVAVVICVLIGRGAAGTIGESLPECYVDAPSHVQTLAAIRSSDSQVGGISGGIFLIVGQINSDRTYFYYVDDEGWLSPRHLNGDGGIYIHEEARQDAVLETHDWRFKKPWYSLLGIRDFGHTYSFRVPVGTVKKEFALR